MRGRFWIVAVLAVGLVALPAACARAPGAGGEDADETSRRAPGIFFPRTRKVLDSGPLQPSISRTRPRD